MDPILSPIILYAGLALGAVGVAVAMPRRGVNPQIIGALIAGVAVGGILIALALIGARSGEGPANLFFYIFSAIGLGAGLRVITHPRPIYAALYFILTALSTAGLFLLLAAEFMTFALIIIYAGAILITYLFVIMLATQAPRSEAVEMLNDYDAHSRDPVISTIVGFALLGALTGMLSLGVPALPDRPAPEATNPRLALNRMPGKVQAFLEQIGIADVVAPAAAMVDEPPRPNTRGSQPVDPATLETHTRWAQTHSAYVVQSAPDSPHVGTIILTLRDPERFGARLKAALALAKGETPGEDLAGVEPLPAEVVKLLVLPALLPPDPDTGVVQAAMWLPVSLEPQNLESVGLDLVGEHPFTLELAGVILLMAMLGAVVLARKQTEVDEQRKAIEAQRLGLSAAGGAA